MNEHNHTTSNSGRNGDEHAIGDKAMDLDVLIGRIIDGEASGAERQRFEELASNEVSLWRRLALRQQDMSMLVAHVGMTLDSAARVELPVHDRRGNLVVTGSVGQADRVASSAARWSWWTACAGWAAVIALAAMWGISERLGSGRLTGQGVKMQAVSETPEQHLREYLHAPFVLGEMPPTLLNVEDLPDGRCAVSYLRRIVEVSYFNSPSDIAPFLDEEGNLTSAPHELSPSTQPAAKPKD